MRELHLPVSSQSFAPGTCSWPTLWPEADASMFYVEWEPPISPDPVTRSISCRSISRRAPGPAMQETVIADAEPNSIAHLLLHPGSRHHCRAETCLHTCRARVIFRRCPIPPFPAAPLGLPLLDDKSSRTRYGSHLQKLPRRRESGGLHAKY